jgi:hypothetical protein
MMLASVRSLEPRLLSVREVVPIVFVVDDDVSVRESLEVLVRYAGWRIETFASAQEFLDHRRAAAPSCLVLDVNLPDLDGLDWRRADDCPGHEGGGRRVLDQAIPQRGTIGCYSACHRPEPNVT